MCAVARPAPISQAESYSISSENDVDWWTGAGPHLQAILESATELAKWAEELEATVRSVMADNQTEGVTQDGLPTVFDILPLLAIAWISGKCSGRIGTSVKNLFG